MNRAVKNLWVMNSQNNYLLWILWRHPSYAIGRHIGVYDANENRREVLSLINDSTVSNNQIEE